MELTDQNFNQEIEAAEKPVLVDFYADWCGPCAMLSPILQNVADAYKEKIIFAKANVDSAAVIAGKYGVEQIPTVVLFWQGKPASGFVGARSEQWIREWLDKELKNIKT